MPSGATTSLIAPLPDAAFDLPPAVAAVDVTPAPGAYPHRALAGQAFEIDVRAYTPEGTPPLRGVLRWRKVLSPHWQEQSLQNLGCDAFSVQWTPPEPGDYEWCVELWAGDDDLERPGSSGADVLQFLRADRPDIAGARWTSAPRSPLGEIAAMLSAGDDVLLLAPIFPQDAAGLVGRDGVGHYSIDPSLGDTRQFGELAAAARLAGVSLALTVPLECSPDHPLRQKHADAFGSNSIPNLAGESWRALWSAWQSVFRFWIVQGIDIFYIPRPSAAPVSFWQSLLDGLRDDFPATVFTTSSEELRARGEHLHGAGFVAVPSQSPRSEVTPAPPTETPQIPEPDDPPEFIADEDQLEPLPLLDDAAAEETLELPPVEAPIPHEEQSVACSCSNAALEVRLLRRGEGYVLNVENREPSTAHSGHIHIDPAALDLTEHDRYYMRDLADGRAYRWSGTTNFLALAAGETAKTFRLERN